ncbi:MAG TPA: PHP domain-containing protein [Gemmatimonadales bacterium]|nr:PHP domain-containing protein [Gemmatimonadales bacterium]
MTRELNEGPYVDLHVHTTASDGALAPSQVVARAAAAGLAAIAITDHDTIDGLPEAVDAGARAGVRVVTGCEFSVGVPWGEMHLLGYFLPAQSHELAGFLGAARADRERRAREMVERLAAAGAPIAEAAVFAVADGASVGRPHVARALLESGAVKTLDEAFDRFLGRGRPAFVEKRLPAFRDVAALVHRLGGVVSAAHLKDRGTRSNLNRLRGEGLDAVETRHPSHDADTRARLTDLALALGLARSGGSDWHGESADGWSHGALGSQGVPLAWLDGLEAARPRAA